MDNLINDCSIASSQSVSGIFAQLSLALLSSAAQVLASCYLILVRSCGA
jgi:hypothetical protein